MSGQGAKAYKDGVVNSSSIEKEDADDFLTKFLLFFCEIVVTFDLFSILDQASLVGASPSMRRVAWACGERMVEAFESFENITR